MTTKYVALTGNNANAGSASAPWRNIQYATAHVSPGDSIEVADGTYVERVAPAVSGTNWTIGSGAIYVYAATGATVWIQPSGGDNCLVFFGVAYHIWQNINLDGINLTAVEGANLVISGGAHHIRFTGADCNPFVNKNAYWSGVSIASRAGGGATYVEILKGIIRDGGRVGTGISASHGVSAGGTNNVDGHQLYQDLEIFGFTGRSDDSGIRIYSGDVTDRAVGTVIDRCDVHDNGDGLVLNNSQGGITVKNTIVCDNANTQVYYSSDINSCPTWNCTIVGNEAVRIEVGNNNNILQNNILRSAGNVGAGAFNNFGTGTVADHNVSVNPLFVNAASNDYHLTLPSPAVDAGVTLAAVPIDYDLLRRPQGSAYCVGAYELPRDNFLIAF